MKNQFKHKGRWKDEQINRKLESKYFEALAKADTPKIIHVKHQQ